MVRMLWTDLRRLFGDYHIYVCMAGLGILYLVTYLETFADIPESNITNIFHLITEGTEILLLAFLLCIVGGSFLYCADEKHGYMKFEIQRIGVGAFTICKLLTSFLGGFLTVIGGNSIFLVGVLLHKFFVIGSVPFKDPYIVMELVWLFTALRCGVLSAIGFLVTTYVTNFYIAMTIPLLLYYGILQVEGWFSYFFPWFPNGLFFSSIYHRAKYGFETEQQRYLFALLYTACIFVVMYRMAKKRIVRRLEHG